MESKIIVIQINSGLGNQMFQYAFGKALEKQLQKKVYFDVFSDFENPSYRKLELEPFNIELTKANVFLLMRFKALKSYHFHLNKYSTLKRLSIRFIRRYLNDFCFTLLKNIYKPIIITENDLREASFDLFNLNFKINNVYIYGYFQCETFAKSIEDELHNSFKLRIDYLINTEIATKILNSNSVSIHVRRGDYLVHSFFSKLPFEYYTNAIEYIKSKVSSPVFFVFSDDINWVKEKFCNLEENYVFMTEKYSENSCDDLLLMSYCKHNIIANSTYSWWGAWLNQNPNKLIIAPSTWYNDTAKNNDTIEKLIPKNWIII